MIQKQLLVFPLLLSLFASPALPQEIEPSPDADVSEEITVSEASVLVDFGEELAPRQLSRITSAQVVVLEEGVRRPVVRLEPVLASADKSWGVLLYFDASLSSAETIRRAASGLGSVATALTQIGVVRIVIADPEPREFLRSRSAIEVEDALALLAKDAPGRDRLAAIRGSLENNRPEGRETASENERRAALAREVSLVRLQNDRLLRLVGEGCEATACALFLVSDGFDIRPAQHYLGDAASLVDLELGEQVRLSAIELADSLSALERVTVIPLLEPEKTSDRKAIASPQSSFDNFLIQQGTYFDGIKVPLGRRARGSSTGSDPASPIKGLDSLIKPSLEPLRQAADVSSGIFVHRPERLLPAIQSLALRYRVWYQTPRQLDGQVVTLEAQLTNGRTLGVPRFAEASTPHGVAAARARGALVGEGRPGDLKIQAKRQGDRLELEIDWGAGSQSVSSGFEAPIRVTVAQQTDRGIQVAHRMHTIDSPSADGDSLSIDISAFGPGPLAVHAEDLRFQVWGTSVVE